LQVFDIFQKLNHSFVLLGGQEETLHLIVLKQPRWLSFEQGTQSVEPGFWNDYGFHRACSLSQECLNYTVL